MNIFSVKRVGVPVISVGNLVAGGTGKTPFVELLTRMLTLKGKKVAIISRGYKRTTSSTVVVSDGKTLLQSAQNAGDEAFQIAKKFPAAVVIVDEQRYRAARLAMERFNVDVILLDDGFQHRSLQRELDVVMIDGERLSHNRMLLPAGLMREPFSSLRRAHVLVRSSDMPIGAEDLRRFTFASVIDVRRVAKALVGIVDDSVQSLSEVQGRTCIAFCGIGNPQSFYDTLDEIKVRVKEFLTFRDHYPYSLEDIQHIEHCARELAADLVLTTEKDAIRSQSLLAPGSWLAAHSFFIEIELKVIDGAEVLDQRINDVMRKVA